MEKAADSLRASFSAEWHSDAAMPTFELGADLKASLKTTLETILNTTRQLVYYDVAEITLWDDEQQCCITQGWGGDRTYVTEAGGVYHVDEGYTGWIIRHQRFLLVRDVEARRDVRPKLDLPTYPFQSYVGIPLKSQGRFIGTLELACYHKDAWSERDLEILQAIANQAVVAIENAYLYAQTRRHAEQQAGLARIAALAASTLDLDELLKQVIGETLKLVEAEKGALLLYNEPHGDLTTAYLTSSSAPALRLRPEHSPLAQSGSYLCNHPAQDPRITGTYRDYFRTLGFHNFAGVVLRLKDSFLGELYLGDRKGGFSTSDLQLLQTVAGYIATAIENARLYDEMRHRVSELSSLMAVSATVSASLDLEQVLRAITSAMVEVIGCQRSAIFVLDETEQVLRLAMTQGLSEEYAARSQTLTLEPGGRAHAVVTGRPLIVDDVQADDGLLAYAPMSIQEGFRAFADLPLKRADRIIGMLSAMFVEPHHFSAREVELLTAFADQAAIAIENARLYAQADEELRRREETLRRRNRELATLYEAANTINSSLSLDDVLNSVAYQMIRLLNSQGCAISLWDRQRDVLESLVAYGVARPRSPRPVRRPDESARSVLETRRPLVMHRDGRAVLLLPLVTRNQVIGVVELIDSGETHTYTPEETRLAESLAAQAAVAIENARLYEQAQQEIAERARAEEALRRLHNVSREINATLHLERILHLVLEEATHLSQAPYGAILLRDAPQDAFHLEVSTGYTEEEQEYLETLLRQPESHPVLSMILNAPSSLLIADTSVETDKPGFRPETLSLLIVPIFYQGALAGLIVLESPEKGAFNLGTLEFVEGLAAQAATAIGNAQRYQEQLQRGELLRRRAERLAAVLEVSRALRSDRPLEKILEEIAYAIQESVGFNLVLIGILEGDPPYRRRVAAAGVPLAEFEQMKQIREPWSALADVMTSEFRISQSYYIPAEHQARWRGRISVYEAVDGDVRREPGRWHPHDLLLVPLIGPGGDIQGLLSVDQPVNGRIPDLETIEALEIFASQAALAIENARLMETLERRAETLAMFNEVSRSTTTHLETANLDDVLSSVVRMILRPLKGDLSMIFLLDTGSGEYSLKAVQGIAPGEPPPGLRKLISAVAESRMPLTTELDTEEINPVALAPLTVSNQVVGVLCVGRRAHQPFSPAEVGTLSALADQVAVAVANIRLFDEVRRFSQELEQRVEERTRELAQALRELQEERDRAEMLYRIASQLSASLDLDHVLTQALKLVAAAVEAERATVLMLPHDSDRFIYRASYGNDTRLPPGGRPTSFSRDEGVAGWVVKHRQAVIIPDMRQDQRWVSSWEGERKYRSVLAVPLTLGDQVLGVFFLFHSQPGHFDEKHMMLVETVAMQMANAINNAELYRLIFDQAEQLGNMLKAQKVEAAKSQAILEAVADGVIVVDASGKTVLFNAAAERILELPREKALGRLSSDMLGLYGSQASEWMEAVNRWASQPGAYDAEENLAARAEIGGRIVSVHLAPVLMGDEFLGTVSVFRDVTAEVEAERAKTEFVSMVSHELRTPMTSIKGYVKLLLMEMAGKLTEEQRHFLSIINTNVDRLTNLINDLLDISRIESGRLAISPRPIQVHQVIEQVMAEMHARATSRGLKLYSELPPVLPKVIADPDRVAQILTNLVANACNYTPSGGEVCVLAHVNGGEVHIAVRDTGIGIAPENLDKIFERFFRADDELVREVPGTGLGLAIVRSLVEMQGGRIWVESQLGAGSTFTFTLPIANDSPVQQPSCAQA
ncbi:MAG: GAF domain-containing protein [Anaerolineae bacterium]|nr:GAF domain-containing protein [Anaerolineae bacterium]